MAGPAAARQGHLEGHAGVRERHASIGAALRNAAGIRAGFYSTDVQIAVALEGATAVLAQVHRADTGQDVEAPESLERSALPGRVAELEAAHSAGPLRWIWADTRTVA